VLKDESLLTPRDLNITLETERRGSLARVVSLLTPRDREQHVGAVTRAHPI
jgi:hypothetical protein